MFLFIWIQDRTTSLLYTRIYSCLFLDSTSQKATREISVDTSSHSTLYRWFIWIQFHILPHYKRQPDWVTSYCMLPYQDSLEWYHLEWYLQEQMQLDLRTALHTILFISLFPQKFIYETVCRIRHEDTTDLCCGNTTPSGISWHPAFSRIISTDDDSCDTVDFCLG